MNKNMFGMDFEIEEIRVKGLPVYMLIKRHFYKFTYQNISFVLVGLSPDEKFGSIALKKQAVRYEEKFELPVAFQFENISRTQRDSLLKNNLAFVDGETQIYLPFLGASLSNRFKSKSKADAEKMMPITQALFLYMLYKTDGKPVLKKDAADYLGVTRTSITRASEQLAAMKLITQEKCGKEVKMCTIETGLRLYEAAKKYMISPVQKVVTVGAETKFDILPLAGESALSKCTMLAAPSVQRMAVYKASIQDKDLSQIDRRWETDMDALEVELWKYDPTLFMKNGVVDPISLALSFSDNADERIEEALEDCLEGYEW